MTDPVKEHVIQTLGMCRQEHAIATFLRALYFSTERSVGITEYIECKYYGCNPNAVGGPYVQALPSTVPLHHPHNACFLGGGGAADD
jgi:hypothetical protein